MTDTRPILIVGAGRREALEMSYARAFARLGRTVERWDPQAALHRAAHGGNAGALFSTFVNVEPWVRKANVELLQLVERVRPEAILVIAAAGVRAGTLAQCRVLSPATRLYMLYPDSPHGLDAERIECMRVCDRVTGSTPPWAEAFRAFGARRAHYLPFAADTELYPAQGPAPDGPRKREVGFVGTWRPEREALLERLREFDVAVWGGKYWASRTERRGTVRARWAGTELVGEALVRASAETAVMLNILDPITWPGPNMRSFELPACGAFVLSQRSPAILDVFREGEDIACFDSAEEAADKIRHYLPRGAERARMAASAYARVSRDGHTYLDRAKTISAWLAEDA